MILPIRLLFGDRIRVGYAYPQGLIGKQVFTCSDGCPHVLHDIPVAHLHEEIDPNVHIVSYPVQEIPKDADFGASYLGVCLDSRNQAFAFFIEGLNCE